MRKLKIVSFVLCLVPILNQAQNFSSKLATSFSSYREKYAQEKIYLTTDRQFYLTGELVWFKVYCVDASFHKPSSISKIAYVEIIDRNHKAIAQAKIELNNGVGDGSFFLPTSISSDNYVLRGYTHWMKNFDPELYFHKVVSIVNPFVRMESPSSIIPEVKFEFFPEGGSLVASVPTRVAYKLSVPVDATKVRGFLLNERNDTIKHLTVDRNGLSNFEITADANHKYKVLVKATGKVNSFHDFLNISPSGYAMKLTDNEGEINVQVQRVSEGEAKEEEVTLFVQTRNILTYNQTKTTVEGKVIFSLLKESLPPGVSHLSVFNQAGLVVCQRLHYKESNISPSVATIANGEVGLRAKNSLALSALGSKNISISISKVDSLPMLPRLTISNCLWLFSDIGYESFGTFDPKEVDNLLLTKTWKRFNWQDVLKGSRPTEYLPEPRGHVVQLKVTDDNSLPRKDVTVYLSSPGSVFSFHVGRSDEYGDAFFELNNFYGSQRLIAQTNRTLDSTSVIKIQNPYSDRYAGFYIPFLKLDESCERRLLERSVRMQVQNIFFEDFESKFQKPDLDTLPFYGRADERYKLDDYTRFPLMEEVMREYVPGVNVRKKKDGFNFFVIDKKHNLMFKDNPLILLDGVPIFDANEIIQFDPLKIKRLEVITGKYFYGNLELPGIVSYFTYQGDLANFSIRSKNGLVDFDGIQTKRVFYAPTHSSDSEAHLPDPRYLLVWNPTAEKKDLEFFTSDVAGTYHVTVEGISKNGSPIYATSTFVVKR